MTVTIRDNQKITASKDTLNHLSLLINEAANSYKSRGRNALSEEAMEASEAIFDALEAIGYYN